MQGNKTKLVMTCDNMKLKLNKEWHQQHRMPKNPGVQITEQEYQRIGKILGS